MPGQPKPVGSAGGMPPIWVAVMQKLSDLSAQVRALNAGSTQQNIIDQYGNTVEVAGTNLNQTVTIGAAFQQTGVTVTTGLPSSAGRAFSQGLVTTTITLTKGSASATVASSSGLGSGMLIGAALVNDPSTGVATPAITPGTTISGTPVGTTVTLSAPAAESGTALYCAAVYWRTLSGLTYP